jgi:hypothetical protein
MAWSTYCRCRSTGSCISGLTSLSTRQTTAKDLVFRFEIGHLARKFPWVEPAMMSRSAVYTLRKLAIDGASLTKPVSLKRFDIRVWAG